MPFNPISGIQGFVQVGAFLFSFGKWSLAMETKSLPVNNFNGLGFQQVVAGVTKAELTLDALTYDQGNMPFATGSFYTFNLGYSSTASIAVQILVEKIEPTIDYDGLEAIKITGQSNGIFTAAIA